MQLQLNLDGLRKTTQDKSVIVNSIVPQIYRDLKDSSITVSETPTKNKVKETWKSIWEKEIM